MNPNQLTDMSQPMADNQTHQLTSPESQTVSRGVLPTGTESRACADIAARQTKGVAKYGTTVEANPLTLKAWLQHAYEECLDQAIYLKRAIEEMEK